MVRILQKELAKPYEEEEEQRSLSLKEGNVRVTKAGITQVITVFEVPLQRLRKID